MNPGEKFDQQLCFNASENKNIIIYALFPGQKIFVSVFHPMSISPHLELTGRIENGIFRNRRLDKDMAAAIYLSQPRQYS